MDALGRQLYQLAAELGELHLKRREPAKRVEVIDQLIAEREAQIDALMKLQANQPQPTKEGGTDAPAPPAPVDAAPDRSAPAR